MKSTAVIANPIIKFGFVLAMIYGISLIASADAGEQLPPTALQSPGSKQVTKLPNIIFIFCDNLGYADIEPFGAKKQQTPYLVQLAKTGRKFTHCYSASGVCTPSRAALMTGCYPQRNSMSLTDGVVLRPVSQIGLHPQEWTVAEQLKLAGYATSIFGKWHLGDQPDFLPTRQGFDFYHGIPYSDDMTPRAGTNWPPLPLMKNETVVEAPTDRNLLAQKLTRSACAWIKEHQAEPFFLYFPQCMPGSTTAPFASAEFRGKSNNGPWGDSIEEIDWSLGEILKTLDELELTEQTLIIWTSDNGAPQRNPHQGLNTPLAGWGYSTQEGGMRVPCIMSWPARIASGSVCEELCTMMDFLPTFAAITKTKLPEQIMIDGHNIEALMTDSQAPTPYEVFFYYHLGNLEAARSGRFKYYYQWPLQKGKLEDSVTESGWLFDVVADPGETQNLAALFPGVIKEFVEQAAKIRPLLGDGDLVGSQVRAHGICNNPQPQLLPEK